MNVESGNERQARQERRDEKLRKKKERMSKHGKSLARVYGDAMVYGDARVYGDVKDGPVRDFVLEDIIRDWFSSKARRARYSLDDLMDGTEKATRQLYKDMQEEGLVGPDEFDQFMLSFSEYSKTVREQMQD